MSHKREKDKEKRVNLCSLPVKWTFTGRENIPHLLCTLSAMSSVYVCAACVQHVCICNFPILLIPLPLCVRVLMCEYLPGEDSESNQQRTHFLSPRSLSPSPSYDLFSPCYESDPCGCYWEWVSEVLRLRLFMCLGWCVRACVCARASLYASLLARLKFM